MSAPGRRRWLIAGGHVSVGSTGREPELTSHDAISVLNAGEHDAEVRIMWFAVDREPIGPFVVMVRARRVRRIRINDLIDPQALPLGVDYALSIEADHDVVVQFTSQDTSSRRHARMTTIAFPAGE